jgi:hypothetical protein
VFYCGKYIAFEMETYGSRRADYKFGSSAYALNDIEEKK